MIKSIVRITVTVVCLTFFMSLFVPVTCTGDIESARTLKAGNSGCSIVKSMISANVEREGEESLWPQKGEYKTANEFFASLLADDVLPGISLTPFSGAGVPAADNLEQFRTENHNIWNVVAGLNDDTSDALPFLFSKNFSITAKELMNANPNDNTTDWSHKITEDLQGIGKRVIVISKGAAMNAIKAKYLTPAAVLNGACYTNDIEILKAVE